MEYHSLNTGANVDSLLKIVLEIMKTESLRITGNNKLNVEHFSKDLGIRVNTLKETFDSNNLDKTIKQESKEVQRLKNVIQAKEKLRNQQQKELKNIEVKLKKQNEEIKKLKDIISKKEQRTENNIATIKTSYTGDSPINNRNLLDNYFLLLKEILDNYYQENNIAFDLKGIVCVTFDYSQFKRRFQNDLPIFTSHFLSKTIDNYSRMTGYSSDDIFLGLKAFIEYTMAVFSNSKDIDYVVLKTSLSGIVFPNEGW